MKRYVVFLYIALIFILTIIPFQKSTLSDINEIYVLEVRLDYLFHIILFLPWVFICEFSFGGFTNKGRIFVLLVGVFLAAASELFQLMILYRAFNINDLIYNVAGILAGSIIWIFFYKRNKVHEKSR
ncbi:MAG: VanZ family protein [Bacteroidetes bacterium]|nr:VanZ family protein [Bacteroidota bacterium]